MNICCRCYRYEWRKKQQQQIPLHSNSFCFIFSHFHQHLETFFIWFQTSLVRVEWEKAKKSQILYWGTHIHPCTHIHALTPNCRKKKREKKNFAMNGKADVFFVQFYFCVQFFAFIHWCLCFHFLFVLFLCRFIPLSFSYGMFFYLAGVRVSAHQHTHSLSFFSHFSSFSRLVHCLDTTSLMLCSLLFFVLFSLSAVSFVFICDFTLL